MVSMPFKMKKKCKGRILLFCITIIVFVAWVFLPLLDIVSAQEKYPMKPINFFIGFAPGGPADLICRGLTTAASKDLGQPFITLYKPGGATAVSLGILKNEKPDGYTLGHLGAGGTIAPLMRNLNYDIIRDFTPIMQFGETLSALAVQSDSPWKTWRELVEYARANPGKIRFGSYGPGSVPSLVMEQVARREKIKWTHIPFEGTNPATSALLGGHVEAIADIITWQPHAVAGRLRVLAAFNTRLPFAPNAPTLMEMYGFDCPISSFVVGPKGISPGIVKILQETFKKAMGDQIFLDACQASGYAPVYRSSEESTQFIVKVNEFYSTWLKDLHLLK